MNTKECRSCLETLPIEEFRWVKTRNPGPRAKPGHWHSYCRECSNRKGKEYKRRRRESGKAPYANGRPSVAHRSTLVEMFGNRCNICDAEPEPDRFLAVDHDHLCCPDRKWCWSCVRGLLCTGCNVGIGYLRDDPDILQKAREYLLRKDADERQTTG